MKRYLVFEKSTDAGSTCIGSFTSLDQARQASGGDALLISAGLKLAIQDGDATAPALVERWSGVGDQFVLELRVFRAASPYTGSREHIPAARLSQLSRDFLRAEDQQALSVAKMVLDTDSPRYFRGRLFLKNLQGEVFWLEHDCSIEVELEPGKKSQWKVKDLLPGLQKVVLREPAERNGLAVSDTVKLNAASRILRGAKVLSMPRFRFAHQTPHERHNGYRRLPLVWAKQMLSNTKGILSVLDTILVRPLPGGLLPEGHPWTSGIDPDTGRTVWSDNVIFATARKTEWAGDNRHWPDCDQVILHKVGTYLAGMARKSASTLEHPFGAPSRMPPAVNYIHGTVSYNAGILLFNDFEEGIYHLSDPRFVAEMKRFAGETGREIMIIFRERVYEPRDYAYFAGMIRSVLPWFSNTNGPVRARTAENEADVFLVDGKVMWGNPAPYPVVNPITGNWIADVYALVNADAATLRRICRAVIGTGHFFLEQYQGGRQHAQRMERLLAIGTAKRVQARGDNLFFVSQTDLDKERELTRLARPSYIQLSNEVRVEPVVVIGGGAAGLAVSQQLKKRGIPSLVLERSEAPGATWRGMPTNLSLLTRWAQNELPDTPDSIRPTEAFVDARRYARYLENYAAWHQLTVARSASVALVYPREGGVAVDIAGGGTLHAREVINATGGMPFVPNFPGSDQTTIPRLHFGAYRDPAQVASLAGGRDKHILVVGKGISAGQVLLELEKSGFAVDLSVRGPMQYGASPRWSRMLQRILPLVEGARRLFGLGGGRAPKLKMPGGQTRKLIDSGRVVVRGDILRVEGNRVLFTDGTEGTYDLVFYCTGFRPQVAHLPGIDFDTETGLPALHEMESVAVPHLHFLGLDGLRGFRSRFLRGIREDAAVLAARIAARLTS